MNWLLKNFLRGLIIVVPIAVTLYLLVQAFLALDALLRLPTPGLGIVVLLAATVLIGAIAGNFLGRRIFGLTEKLFTKAPIVRIVYAAIKDLLEAFVGNKRRFDRPVTISVTPDVRTFGFITQDDLAALGLPGDVAVYVPFSYTWDGCLLVVARERVRPLDADSASIMALVVSGGVSRM
ncbi:MAG TPA: DUF502 domain-containing protein [Thermoanaerobaculia bacterium]|jgi:uncharacterized membrane protein|nr:DUF502 domain-containing protein [Thermoanaerobaculia bacterium]